MKKRKNSDEPKIEKAKIVLVGFEKEKDKYNSIKSLATELSATFEEASELAKQAPVEILRPLPIEAAENLAERLSESGAIIEVVPLSIELGGGRTCYRHPHKLAMAKCKVCGKLICAICLRETGGKFFCQEHWARHKLMRKLRVLGTLAAIGGLFLFWALFQDQLRFLGRRLMPVETTDIALVIFTQNASEKTSLIYNNRIRTGAKDAYREGDDHTLADVDSWFQKQFQEITANQDVDIIDIDVYGLYEAEILPPAFGFEDEDSPSLEGYFKEFSKKNDFSLGAYDYTIFVLLVDKSPIPEDFMEQITTFKHKIGLMLYPTGNLWSNDYYVATLAHLVARMMGSSLKLDDKGFPQFPIGYAEPGLTNLYPQNSAEITACYLPENKFTIGRISSMDQVIIGAETAYELGWVSSGYVNEAYAGLQ